MRYMFAYLEPENGPGFKTNFFEEESDEAALERVLEGRSVEEWVDDQQYDGYTPLLILNLDTQVKLYTIELDE